MKYLLYICIIIFSQIFVLGVFSEENTNHYVVNYTDNLCWIFTIGNAQNPNWLMQGWVSIEKDENLWEIFNSSLSCLEWSVSTCCKDLGFRYAWVPIGIEIVNKQRKWAEFLASKWYIQNQSLSPSQYKLEDNITRKELMKIILNISQKEVVDECREIFADVQNDWGCKYIESALENDFIVWNTQFRPDDFVTKTEALKLIFKARNIEKRYNTNYWQQDYVSTAYYLSFIDEKFSNFNNYISRGELLEIAARTYEEFKNW